MLFALMSIGLMGPSSCGGCDAALQLPGIPEAARALIGQFLTDDEGLEPQMHGRVQPRLTGSDGAQTGVASFWGTLQQSPSLPRPTS
jgi:hypothetical protein